MCSFFKSLICVYLACKIEEFNISISQFVQHIPTAIESPEELANIILSYELLLMEKLSFHLNVFNFYRPFEGLLLDLKARCVDVQSTDILRQTANEFLDKTLNTDACLLYPPAQIALTALVHSSSKHKIDIDKYCRNVLLRELSNDEVKQMLAIIKNINRMVREIPVLNLSEIKRIETKLNECYNRENDPRSQAWV